MPTRSAGGSFRGLRLGTAAVVEEARCTAYLFESAVVRSRLVKNAPIKSRSAPRSMGRSSGYGAKTPTSLVLKARAGSRSAPPKSPKDFMRSAYWWPSKYAKATRCENDPSKRHASNSLTTSSLKSPPLLPPTKDAFDRSWLRRSRKRSSIGSRRASYRAKLEAVSSPTSGSEDRSTQSASPPSNSSNVVLATAPSSSRRKAADGVRSTQSASAKAALSSLLRTAPKYAVRRGRSLVATSWNSTHSSSSTPAPSEKKADDGRGPTRPGRRRRLRLVLVDAALHAQRGAGLAYARVVAGQAEEVCDVLDGSQFGYGRRLELFSVRYERFRRVRPVEDLCRGAAAVDDDYGQAADVEFRQNRAQSLVIGVGTGKSNLELSQRGRRQSVLALARDAFQAAARRVAHE
mmetsp:Transcript_31601/g.108679  ORF Transcript_31601/g.108679 Transcript_31601/m.108679 type:complete len:404 (+) Transcript_31601:615-1826(+)